METLYLYISSKYLIFEPAEKSHGTCLIINRETESLEKQAPFENRKEEVIMVYGIVGTVKLHSGHHLVLITGRKREGQVQGKDIWKITKHLIVPISILKHKLSETEARDDAVYLSLLDNMMSSPFHYFSYNFDITQSIQRQAGLANGSLLSRADDRFFWNKFLCAKLIDDSKVNGIDLGNYIIPVICGFFSSHSVRINSRPMQFVLISRRSRFRTGTRYNVRGIDVNGNVANNVETEQIIIDTESNTMCSYVQTRGSIPLFWSQIVNIKYSPKLEISKETTSQFEAFKRHFNDEIERYGKQIVVNLINKKGYENPLGLEFASFVTMLNDSRVRYIHFDFHKECSKMRWDRISLLVQEIESDLLQQGYFNGKKKQTSVVRTNCMDCLDRTNVVQSILGKRILNIQLRDLGVLGGNETIENIVDFEKLFRNVWADNADAISTQYSGTGALKTDFTRTGKRTKAGILRDGLNSCIRYLKNNYSDGYRQDAFDLFHGSYQVVKGRNSPFSQERDWVLPMVFAISVLMMLFLLFVNTSSLDSLVYVGFWMLISAVSLYQIVANGEKYVDRPRLLRPFESKKTA